MKTQQEEALPRRAQSDGELAQKNHRRCSAENLWMHDRSIQRLSWAGSGFRIAADRPERRRTAITRAVPAHICPSAADILRDDLAGPWPGSSVSGGNEQKAILLYCASACGNWRNGDWQRRDTCVRITAVQVWDFDDLASPPETFVLVEADNVTFDRTIRWSPNSPLNSSWSRELAQPKNTGL